MELKKQQNPGRWKDFMGEANRKSFHRKSGERDSAELKKQQNPGRWKDFMSETNRKSFHKEKRGKGFCGT